MKKIIAFALIIIMALSIFGCAKKSPSDILSLEEINTQYYTDDEIADSLKNINRDDLIKAWGDPDRTAADENEDTWVLNEKKVLIIVYNLFGEVYKADIYN